MLDALVKHERVRFKQTPKTVDATHLDVCGTFLSERCLNVLLCPLQKWLNRSMAKPQTDSDTR